MKVRVPLTILILAPIAASCGNVRLDPVAAPYKAELEPAASRRVFFGHQSVGYNIIDGIISIERKNEGAGLRVVEGVDARILDKPAIAHAAIGVNGDPSGKIKDFVSIVERGVGERVDIALMKFCYVDVGAHTDIEALFSEYSGAISRLRSEYPRAAFPMTTIPLTTVERGPKALAKKLLGLSIRGKEDNAARERFNALVRRQSTEGDGFFDLARLESEAPGSPGSRDAFENRDSLALREEYSSDGGHLNIRGASFIAERFISFIAETKPPLRN